MTAVSRLAAGSASAAPHRPRRRPVVALDAVGGDAGAIPVVEAALASTDLVDVLLVGEEAALVALLPDPLPDGIVVADAPEAVGMADDPVLATRTKRRSSLMVAAEAVANGAADAMVTPGNTGAALLAATARMRRLPGIIHPALAVELPCPDRDHPTILTDVGATVDCPATWLVQFAAMGVELARCRYGIPQPTVALLSNGSERGKGGPVRVAAHDALARRADYVGLVEGHDLLTPVADVVVTDGFTGNVALKTFEGAARATALVLRSSARDTLGAADDELVRWLLDARSVLRVTSGSVVLGLGGVCVIAHGSSDADDLKGAIALARRAVGEALTERIAAAIDPGAHA